MISSNNVNIESKSPLTTPAELKDALPLADEYAAMVIQGRNELKDILDGKSKRFIIITGPCSIHSIADAHEYARRLRVLNDEVKDKILLIMRVYFEKPRTTLGWKGLIYDPDINGSYNIEKGLFTARKLLLDIVKAGLHVGTEMLDPIIPQYIADSVVWAAIGARTTESQPHRQMASGLSMPVGFKNATDGSIKAATDAIEAARARHSFIGIISDGHTGIFRTKGNPYGHIVLRGGEKGPNYGAEYIAFVKVAMQKQGLAPNIIVDCSHANSNKQCEKQKVVFQDVLEQIQAGEDAIKGVMIESNLKPGSQEITGNITPGISITDSCIGWEDTEALIRQAYNVL